MVKMIRALTLVVTVASIASPAWSAVYYVGSFAGSAPSDDSSCGTGRGGSGQPHPCASLAYWTQSRRASLRAGDVVRFAAGTYGPANNANHCILPTAGVTYEGRNADDTVASTAATVTIEMSSTPISSPCQGRAIMCDTCDSSGFALRAMTFKGAKNTGSGAWIHPGQNGQSTGLLLQNLRFTGAVQTGLFIGDIVESPPYTYTLKDVTIDDVEFDRNGFSGLDLGLIDGLVMKNSKAHDNPPTNSYVDNHDGFHIGGVKNGTITDSSAWANGQVGFDFTRMTAGVQCPETANNIVCDRCVSYGNYAANFSFSGASHDITIRNSFAWGDNVGLNFYRNARGIKLLNNTVVSGSRAVMLFCNHTDMDFQNNILVSTGTSGSVVFIDQHTIGSSNGNKWRNNVVAGGTGMVAVSSNNTGEDDPVTCAGESQYTGRITTRKNGRSYDDTATDLAAWKSDNVFSTTTGGTSASDLWGTKPAFVNLSAPSVANLHLKQTDTVAIGKGNTLTASFPDVDGQARPSGAWDIGADQVSYAPGVPVLMSVDPQP